MGEGAAGHHLHELILIGAPNSLPLAVPHRVRVVLDFSTSRGEEGSARWRGTAEGRRAGRPPSRGGIHIPTARDTEVPTTQKARACDMKRRVTWRCRAHARDSRAQSRCVCAAARLGVEQTRARAQEVISRSLGASESCKNRICSFRASQHELPPNNPYYYTRSSKIESPTRCEYEDP